MLNRTHIKAYSVAITNAALSHAAALQIELAVGFAVQLEIGPSKRLARATLVEIYAAAGYTCSEPKDIDWKRINRRIAASLALFDFMSREEVETWTDGKTKGPLIDAIVDKLKPLKLKTVNEVLVSCGKLKPQATRQERPGTVRVETSHLHFSIPPDVTRDELMTAIAKLMAVMQSMPFTQPSVAQPAVEQV